MHMHTHTHPHPHTHTPECAVVELSLLLLCPSTHLLLHPPTRPQGMLLCHHGINTLYFSQGVAGRWKEECVNSGIGEMGRER